MAKLGRERRREKVTSCSVIASEAKQSRVSLTILDRFVALLLAMTARGSGNPYLIGGAYWTPPAFQSWFMPRGIFSLDSLPTLRS